MIQSKGRSERTVFDGIVEREGLLEMIQPDSLVSKLKMHASDAA